MTVPPSFEHNVGLRYLIEPGDDLSATRVRQNFHRIKHAANEMVDASLEPGAINTRHLDDLSDVLKGGVQSDGFWKALFWDNDTATRAVESGTSYVETWFAIFGDAAPQKTIPNVPLFIEVHLEVRDRNELVTSPSPVDIDARYWFELRTASPHTDSVAAPTIMETGGANTQKATRSITLVPEHITGTTSYYTGANAYEHRQVVLAIPFIPSTAPSDDMTTLKVSLFTRTTNYAGTGSASASTATIEHSRIVIKAMRR